MREGGIEGEGGGLDVLGCCCGGGRRVAVWHTLRHSLSHPFPLCCPSLCLLTPHTQGCCGGGGRPGGGPLGEPDGRGGRPRGHLPIERAASAGRGRRRQVQVRVGVWRCDACRYDAEAARYLGSPSLAHTLPHTLSHTCPLPLTHSLSCLPLSLSLQLWHRGPLPPRDHPVRRHGAPGQRVWRLSAGHQQHVRGPQYVRGAGR